MENRDLVQTDVKGKNLREKFHPIKLLLGAGGSANLSDGITLGAFPVIALGFSSSATNISAIQAFREIPWLLLALPAGVFLDRIDKVRSLGTLNILRSVIMLLTAFLLYKSQISISSLLAICFLIGCLEVVNDIALPSMLPTYVPKDELAATHSAVSTVETIANYFAGRSLGSFLAVFMPVVALGVSAVLYFLTACTYLLLPEVSVPAAERKKTGFLEDLKSGISYVCSSRALRKLAIMGGCANFSFGMLLSTFVLYSSQVVKAPLWSFGLLQSSFALGATLVGFKVGKIIRSYGSFKTMEISVAVIPVAFLLIPVLHNMIWLGFFWTICGAAAVVWNGVATSYRQKLTSPEMQARATSVGRLVSWGLQPIGAFSAGPMAELFGLSPLYVVGAIIAGINILLFQSMKNDLKNI